MKELLDIAAAAARLHEAGIPAVLASVVKTQGSTYRHPGARMLLAADGTTVGMVSGGCLENDLRDRAASILASQGSGMLAYDSTSNDDIVWGWGLGCAGMVHVLVEGTIRPEVREMLEWTGQSSDRPFVMATVFRTSGNPGLSVGSRWMLNGTGSRSAGHWSGPLAAGVERECRKAFDAGESAVRTITHDSETAEAFIEFVEPAMPLLIFGAGPDAMPLVRIGEELGWRVTLVDTREAYLDARQWTSRSRILLRQPADLLDQLSLHGREAAVVMTHNFRLDSEFVRLLLPSPVRYVGLLGSRPKSSLLLSKLEEEGFLPDEAARAKLVSPVGLDIGAETPAEIALAVAAEIRSVISRGTGRSLRTLQGSIHALHA